MHAHACACLMANGEAENVCQLPHKQEGNVNRVAVPLAAQLSALRIKGEDSCHWLCCKHH